MMIPKIVLNLSYRFSYRCLIATVLLGIATPVPVTLAAPVRSRPVLTANRYKLPPLPKRGAPGSRGGEGGSRGPCAPTNQFLTAIAPTYRAPETRDSRRMGTHVWGLTSADHPTFWMWVPYDQSQATAEFVLQDEAENDLYRAAVPLGNRAGLMAITLPSTAPALVNGKRYQWFFKTKLTCQTGSTPTADDGREWVNGWIEKTPLSSTIATQLKSASPAETVTLYAEQGFWFDAIDASARLHQANPQDPKIAQQWQDLLQTAGVQTGKGTID